MRSSTASRSGRPSVPTTFNSGNRCPSSSATQQVASGASRHITHRVVTQPAPMSTPVATTELTVFWEAGKKEWRVISRSIVEPRICQQALLLAEAQRTGELPMTGANSLTGQREKWLLRAADVLMTHTMAMQSRVRPTTISAHPLKMPNPSRCEARPSSQPARALRVLHASVCSAMLPAQPRRGQPHQEGVAARLELVVAGE